MPFEFGRTLDDCPQCLKRVDLAISGLELALNPLKHYQFCNERPRRICLCFDARRPCHRSLGLVTGKDQNDTLQVLECVNVDCTVTSRIDDLAR